ncbi:unnamed protein product [Rhizophagus irregularis]|nr:unnamed protein product [Rhizophagus irregularis]
MWNNKKVALKCLHINSHNLIDEFLNEVSAYSAYSNQDFSSNILKLYGISQKDTENYVIVLEYAEATGRQPFADHAHDNLLALNICNGIRPEIDKSKAPKCYIDLMKSCWDSNPKNRPDATKIEELICLFRYSYMLDASEFKLNMKVKKEQQHYEIEKQFKEADEYRKANPLLIKTTHPQAIYTSRLLNPFTGDLPEDDKGVGDDSLVKCDDNMYNNSVEITDFS